MTISKRAITQYMLMYLILIGNRSVLMRAIGDTRFFWMVLLVLALVSSAVVFKAITQKMILFPTALLSVGLLLARMTGASVGIAYLVEMVGSTLLAYAAVMIEPNKAAHRFVKTVCFFACVSVLLYTLSFFFLEQLKALLGLAYSETVVFSKGVGWESVAEWNYYGKLLYSIGRDSRNCGLYTEPGLYQIVLNAALYVLLLHPDRLYLTKKEYMQSIIVIIVAIITSLSAAGLLTTGGIVLYYSFTSKRDNMTKKNKQHPFLKNIPLYIGAVILLVLLDFILRGNKSIVYIGVIEKIQGLSFTEMRGSTGNARLVSALISIKSFLKFPLGAGANRVRLFMQTFENGSAAAGCGLFYYLGTLGILGWGAVVSLTIYPAIKNSRFNKSWKLILFMYVVFGITQTYIMTPVLIFLAYLICFPSEGKVE